MTTTDLAMPALPSPRQPRQVLELPLTQDLQRRPAGAHALPAEALLDVDSYWDAEGEALFAGAAARRPLEQHGRRCGCCRPTPAATAVA